MACEKKNPVRCHAKMIRENEIRLSEALSRIHSHLIVLAEGQDAILKALGKRGRYGQG